MISCYTADGSLSNKIKYMKDKEKLFLLILMIGSCFLFLLIGFVGEIKITNVSYKDFETLLIKKEGIHCVSMPRNIINIENAEAEPVDSSLEFVDLLSPDKQPYLTTIKDDHALRKIYWLILENPEDLENPEVKKYTEEFEYEEDGKKFEVDNYQSQDDGLLITFSHNTGLKNYAFVGFILCFVAGFIVLMKIDTDEEKEAEEKKKKEEDERRKKGGGAGDMGC